LNKKGKKVRIMTKTILVAYYTKEGASEHYAKVIAETLREKRLEVDCINLNDAIPDVKSYETIIVGTGVKMFMVYRRWKKVLKQK
jgi:menaquinone-dependent protoporphyrinogen IX oxidase